MALVYLNTINNFIQLTTNHKLFNIFRLKLEKENLLCMSLKIAFLLKICNYSDIGKKQVNYQKKT